MDVRSISVGEARVLRDAILRAGLPVGGSVYPGDAAPDTLHVGAYCSDRLLAVATICRESPAGAAVAGAWRLRGMATAADARGRGIGRQLALACLAHARHFGASLVWCSAREETVPFYARLGFTPFGDPFRLPEFSDHAYRQMRLTSVGWDRQDREKGCGTSMAVTTLTTCLAQLESLGSEKVRAQNRKQGAGDNQFGVRLGDIRKLAAKIKADDPLAHALWDTGNVDAQFLATLLIEPTKLSADAMDRMVRSITFARVADWLNSYVVAKHPDKEALRQGWMAADDRWAARAGWHLTAERVAKNPDGLDLAALLDRIESEMADAAPEVQWTMNNTLATIGIHDPALRQRAISIGERLGIYRGYPVSKGCTSPFAPIWINAMASRQG